MVASREARMTHRTANSVTSSWSFGVRSGREFMRYRSGARDRPGAPNKANFPVPGARNEAGASKQSQSARPWVAADSGILGRQSCGRWGIWRRGHTQPNGGSRRGPPDRTVAGQRRRTKPIFRLLGVKMLVRGAKQTQFGRPGRRGRLTKAGRQWYKLRTWNPELVGSP